jgi:hypothetical protein
MSARERVVSVSSNWAGLADLLEAKTSDVNLAPDPSPSRISERRVSLPGIPKDFAG